MGVVSPLFPICLPSRRAPLPAMPRSHHAVAPLLLAAAALCLALCAPRAAANALKNIYLVAGIDTAGGCYALA